jgi:hypothetical protein
LLHIAPVVIGAAAGFGDLFIAFGNLGGSLVALPFEFGRQPRPCS